MSILFSVIVLLSGFSFLFYYKYIKANQAFEDLVMKLLELERGCEYCLEERTGDITSKKVTEEGEVKNVFSHFCPICGKTLTVSENK